MGRYRSCWIGLGLLGMACLPGMGAIERTELRSDELRAVVDKLQSHEEFVQATARAQDQRMYLVSSSRYEIDEAGAEKREIAEVVYFKYENGLTIRATLDLRTNELLQVEKLEAYPTPLAAEELAEAVRLAREQSEAVRALHAARPEQDIQVDHLVPVVSDPQSPRYGHRLVILMFEPKGRPEGVVKVEVDLTLRSVRPNDPSTANGSSRGARS